ncbi:uncharacterized protein [Primulina eburnea]|uniref:uncharacterized protein n=1 Tax=Primulina eburnea TaxID=1245227 RepID=UPI003C6CC2B2
MDILSKNTAVLKEKCWLQVNPHGVAAGVATPGRNTTSKSLCLNAKSHNDSGNHEIQDTDSDELTFESVQAMYEELYDDWLKRNETNSILSKENVELKGNLSRLEVVLSKKDLELCKVKDELEKASKTLAKFNSTSEQRPKQNRASSSPLKVDPPVKISQIKKPVSTSKPKQRKRHFICHYCYKPGHIRPFCYKLRDDYLNWKSNRVLPTVLSNTRRNTAVKKSSTRKVWVPKTVIRCNIIYTSLKTNIAGVWYFDSGCSRHMTGSKEHFTDYVEIKSGRVTYGGGSKGRIVGKGTLNVDGLPELHNVLHVEGLNSNLISTRSAENCYQLGEGDDCRSAKVSDLDIWHQKLGHVSINTLKNLCKFDDVRGMPNLNLGVVYVCGPCKKSKQTRVAHPVLQHFGTTQCLELLHMDILGPMDVESLGGYVLNDRDHLAKFDSKSDKCLFLGYSTNGRAYRVFNLRTRTTMESINVVFDDLTYLTVKTPEADVEELLDISEALTRNSVESGVETSEATPSTTPPLNQPETMDNDNDDNDDVVINCEREIPSKIQKNHPSSQIIGELHDGVQTRNKEKMDYCKMIGLICMSSTFSQLSIICFWKLANILAKRRDCSNDGVDNTVNNISALTCLIQGETNLDSGGEDRGSLMTVMLTKIIIFGCFVQKGLFYGSVSRSSIGYIYIEDGRPQ